MSHPYQGAPAIHETHGHLLVQLVPDENIILLILFHLICYPEEYMFGAKLYQILSTSPTEFYFDQSR